MSMGDHARKVFARLPPEIRQQVLHRLGRYAPWEPEFDFTPPPVGPGEETGPPDFVGIGVQKAGTTWWYELIMAHPGVSSPEGVHKERHFFDRFASEPFRPTDIGRYQGWFPRTRGTMTGEWTPDYLTSVWTPPLLKEAAPDTRLLLMLRDPVERLQSGIAHQKRMGHSSLGDVADAIQRGFYHRALDIWRQYFDEEQFLVLQYERCALDPVNQLNSTYRYLGLPEFQPTGLDDHVGNKSDGTIELDPDVKNRLAAVYESDVASLARRLPELDLALWPNFSYLAETAAPSDESNSPVRRA